MNPSCPSLSELFEMISNAQNQMWNLVDAGKMRGSEVDFFAENMCVNNDIRIEQYQDWLSLDTGSREEILNYTNVDMERLYDWTDWRAGNNSPLFTYWLLDPWDLKNPGGFFWENGI